MLSWPLNLAYLALLTLVSPWLLFQAVARGKYRQGWGQKLLGRLLPRNSGRPCVWFHAVSVGEVLQLRPLIEALVRVRPDVEIVVSTTTATGHDVARTQFPGHRVVYFPLDFSWAVAKAFDRIRPTVVVLVELELWPNFLFAAAARQIPVLLVNGRVSERSFRGYRRIRPLVKEMLHTLRRVAVQNETYAGRLVALGADRSRLSVTGSIKFDRVETRRDNPATANLRKAFGLQSHERVFVAGSTHAPEERYALDAWLAARRQHPEVRLILVPRHKERFDEVAWLVEREYGLPLVRRSRLDVSPAGDFKSEISNLKSELSNSSPETLAPPAPQGIGAYTSSTPLPLDGGGVEGGGVFPRQITLAPPSPALPPRGGKGEDQSSAPRDALTSGAPLSLPSAICPGAPGQLAPAPPVLLLDTLGELSACWGLADVAFVGGSLTRRGGQNMIEPAGYGAAVMFGPNTWNFKDVVELLCAQNAAIVVSGADDMSRQLAEWLASPDSAAMLGQRARTLVARQRGATERTVELIEAALSEALTRPATGNAMAA
ncbi:MAG: 3-deoxy-D-manno-octulosonic acid transferase [Planctomycetaceae bacterium]